MRIIQTERKGLNSAKHEIPAPVHEGTPTHIHRENPPHQKNKEEHAKKKTNTLTKGRSN
jgi:hypothetical protein